MKITFIGGGNMASALIAGLAGKLTTGANLHVVVPAQAGTHTELAHPAPHGFPLPRERR